MGLGSPEGRACNIPGQGDVGLGRRVSGMRVEKCWGGRAEGRQLGLPLLQEASPVTRWRLLETAEKQQEDLKAGQRLSLECACVC